MEIFLVKKQYFVKKFFEKTFFEKYFWFSAKIFFFFSLTLPFLAKIFLTKIFFLTLPATMEKIFLAKYFSLPHQWFLKSSVTDETHGLTDRTHKRTYCLFYSIRLTFPRSHKALEMFGCAGQHVHSIIDKRYVMTSHYLLSPPWAELNITHVYSCNWFEIYWVCSEPSKCCYMKELLVRGDVMAVL